MKKVKNGDDENNDKVVDGRRTATSVPTATGTTAAMEGTKNCCFLVSFSFNFSGAKEQFLKVSSLRPKKINKKK